MCFTNSSWRKDGFSHAFAIALTLLITSDLTIAADKGILNVRVIDDNGSALSCRAWVEQGGHRHFQPIEPATATPYNRDESFSCDGFFTMALESGPATVHIERGKAWLPQELRTVIHPRDSTEVIATLQPWIDLTERGYYSADLHIHFGHDNPAVLAQLARADDLDVVPAFTYWLTGRESTWQSSWPDWVNGPVQALPSDRWLTRNNLEIERIASRAQPGGSVGASFLFNLQTPLAVTQFGPRFPTDTDLCLLAQATSPGVVIDTDKPSWAETAVGAILGAYDTVQVCHNHYHRRRTLPGGWGMIGPLTADEAPLGEPNALFDRTNKHYYSFLNCGLRLGVSGGSAIGVMPVPAGYNRVYARVDAPLTPQKFWHAIKTGRSFATSGPMVFLTVDEAQPGEALRYPTNGTAPLRIAIETQSIDALESLELIHNGHVIRQYWLQDQSPDPVLAFRASVDHIPTRSGWYAARVRYQNPTGHQRQAHTSPVYLIHEDRPTAFEGDAQYLIEWVNRLIEIAQEPNRFPSAQVRDDVIHTYLRARAKYETIARLARTTWCD